MQKSCGVPDLHVATEHEDQREDIVGGEGDEVRSQAVDLFRSSKQQEPRVQAQGFGQPPRY